MKTNLYNFKNEVVGQAELPDEVFGLKWNNALIEQALLAQLANKRRPWAHAKTRAEVRGGGAKPWRQKGTGRARHGSSRSPLWVGGGKAHGPLSERDYSQKLNKKMKRLAIFIALSKKAKDNQVKVFETLAIEAPKTKILAGALKAILGKAKRVDTLFVPNLENKNLFRAGANLDKAKVTSPESLNVYDLLNYKNIFIDEKAIPVITKHYQLEK